MIISDKKLPQTDVDGSIPLDAKGRARSYRPHILSSSDYYPFGLAMDGRKFEDEEYRYGFNGKENDKDFGNKQLIQDYGFRLYNPSIAKFLSVDPLADSYPWNSVYAFAEGDVIRSIDLDGLEKLYVTSWVYHTDTRSFEKLDAGTAHNHGNWKGTRYVNNYFISKKIAEKRVDDYYYSEERGRSIMNMWNANPDAFEDYKAYNKKRSEKRLEIATSITMATAGIVFAIPTGGGSLTLIAGIGIGLDAATIGFESYKFYQLEQPGGVEKVEEVAGGVGSFLGQQIGERLGNKKLGDKIGTLTESLFTLGLGADEIIGTIKDGGGFRKVKLMDVITTAADIYGAYGDFDEFWKEFEKTETWEDLKKIAAQE